MDFLELPERTQDERTFGLTSITDFGIPIGELEHILDDYHQFIDFAKFGIGSAYVTPNIQEKVQLYKAYGIKPYFGGTLFEKCYFQNKIDDYFTYLSELKIEWIEISTGILDIPIESRVALALRSKQAFNVIAEIGSKDSEKEMPASQWENEMKALIEAGCQYVIAEGRDSATSGIYESDGNIKEDIISNLVESIDYKKIIFEAPNSKSQMFFINQLGPNVNLGNVKIQDVLLLETQRKGLRAETFYMEESKCKLLL